MEQKEKKERSKCEELQNDPNVNWENVPEEVLECLIITNPKIVVRALSN